MKIVGDRLIHARRALGLNQEEAGALADMHVTSYGILERGSGNPSLYTLIRISHALEVDPSDLVAGLTLADIPDADEILAAALSAKAHLDRKRERRDAARRRRLAP